MSQHGGGRGARPGGTPGGRPGGQHGGRPSGARGGRPGGQHSGRPGGQHTGARGGGPGGKRRGRRPGEVDPVRTAAADTLEAVATSDAYANLVLPKILRERGIAGRDAAFATELVYGTLRLRGRYDAVLARCTKGRPLDQVDPPVLDLLRLGTHQLLGMRVPAHAAVSETVALVRARASQGAGGFANAVLRAVAAADLDTWLARLNTEIDDDGARLAAVESHPAWVVRAFSSALRATGHEVAVLLDPLPPHPEPLPATHLQPHLQLGFGQSSQHQDQPDQCLQHRLGQRNRQPSVGQVVRGVDEAVAGSVLPLAASAWACRSNRVHRPHLIAWSAAHTPLSNPDDRATSMIVRAGEVTGIPSSISTTPSSSGKLATVSAELRRLPLPSR